MKDLQTELHRINNCLLTQERPPPKTEYTQGEGSLDTAASQQTNGQEPAAQGDNSREQLREIRAASHTKRRDPSNAKQLCQPARGGG